MHLNAMKVKLINCKCVGYARDYVGLRIYAHPVGAQGITSI